MEIESSATEKKKHEKQLTTCGRNLKTSLRWPRPGWTLFITKNFASELRQYNDAFEEFSPSRIYKHSTDLSKIHGISFLKRHGSPDKRNFSFKKQPLHV